MNPTILGAIIIIAGYVYGTLLYEPWYMLVQRKLVEFGIMSAPKQPTDKLLGNQVQIVLIAIVLIGIGTWLFVFAT